MANRRSSLGTIEEGYVLFSGQTSQTVNLETKTFAHPQVSIVGIESWDADEDGDIDGSDGTFSETKSDNLTIDRPVTDIANIGMCISYNSTQQFTIHLTAPFYGRVNYLATS